jgi:hypothetical protein
MGTARNLVVVMGVLRLWGVDSRRTQRLSARRVPFALPQLTTLLSALVTVRRHPVG